MRRFGRKPFEQQWHIYFHCCPDCISIDWNLAHKVGT
jgi:hypothetical protein